MSSPHLTRWPLGGVVPAGGEIGAHMNVSEARLALKGPLKFGDAAQLKALDIVIAADRLRVLMEKYDDAVVWCCDCGGAGCVEYPYSDGVVDCPRCGGRCALDICDIGGLDMSELEEAIAEIEEDWES